jgi:hypothetical protein
MPIEMWSGSPDRLSICSHLCSSTAGNFVFFTRKKRYASHHVSCISVQVPWVDECRWHISGRFNVPCHTSLQPIAPIVKAQSIRVSSKRYFTSRWSHGDGISNNYILDAEAIIERFIETVHNQASTPVVRRQMS